MMWDVLNRGFVELKQIRQYDVSYQLDIGHNLSSADSLLTNRIGNGRFLLRKRLVTLVYLNLNSHPHHNTVIYIA